MNGKDLDQSIIDKVWEKATIIDESLNDIARVDKNGNPIAKMNYREETLYGWEISHIKSISEGGTDEVENLQPLHWKNNRHK